MSLPLKASHVRAAYEFLCELPPFDRWNLPDSDDLKFRIGKDRHTEAWHTATGRRPRRHHLIVVSELCVGHTMTLLMAVGHEMVHLHHDIIGIPPTHGAAFQRDAKVICKYHGWDVKTFG